MNHVFQPSLTVAPGELLIVECPAGSARRERLREWVSRQEGPARWAVLTDGDFARRGPWAGVREVISRLYEALREARSDLIAKHSLELIHVLPELRPVLEIKNATLTDLAPDEEKVRNYPADRIYRVVHGLVDLLVEARLEIGYESLAIACDSFDEIGGLGRKLLLDLHRRASKELRLSMVVALQPGQGDAAESLLPSSSRRRRARWDLPGGVEEEPSRESLARRLEEIEEELAADPAQLGFYLPDLLDLTRRLGDETKERRRKLEALDHYSHIGMYEEAIRCADGLLEHFKATDNTQGVWVVSSKLGIAHNALRQVEEAFRLLKALDAVPLEPEWRSQLCYTQAMSHARYLPQRNLEEAEALLEQGIRHLDEAEMRPSKREFQRVFNRNGLALVRFFQSRMEEAVELCQLGIQHLDEHLLDGEHILHRSVLVYNIAQVWAAMGKQELAVEYLTRAMEMDPNYSEYYNERGNAYLKLGRLAEAEADYRRAIELSPPYFEVWANLGQCHRRAGRPEEAVVAYSRALDLEPDQLLAVLGRAQAWEALGRTEEAIAGYTASLELDPDLWEAWANRAVLRFEAGNVEGSIEDLGRAIALEPERGELYQNRAFARHQKGDEAGAAADLETYLRVCPEAPDRSEVEAELGALRAALHPESSESAA